jgi:hypothetical protein
MFFLVLCKKEYAVRATVLTILAYLLIQFSAVANCLAGPPLSGESSSPSIPTWMKPTEWSMPKMPSMPWSKEPARIKKKSPGIMTSMNESAKAGWSKTKRALDPTRMFGEGNKPKSKPAATSSEPGFFGSMFQPKEEKEIRTVNDFLSQPQPR